MNVFRPKNATDRTTSMPVRIAHRSRWRQFADAQRAFIESFRLAFGTTPGRYRSL